MGARAIRYKKNKECSFSLKYKCVRNKKGNQEVYTLMKTFFWIFYVKMRIFVERRDMGKMTKCDL